MGGSKKGTIYVISVQTDIGRGANQDITGSDVFAWGVGLTPGGKNISLGGKCRGKREYQSRGDKGGMS